MAYKSDPRDRSPTSVYENNFVDADMIKRLAAIPTREVLLTQLAYILSQPVASLARVLNKLSEQKGQN